MVVFARPARAVRIDECGCLCPLWLPAERAGEEGVDRAIREEMLEHCRLAVHHGLAEGFLLYGDASLARRASERHALRVVKTGTEYWAKWGAAALAEPPRRQACGASERI
jgi:hypothetical protein